jgi:hypothetical protein
MEEGLFHLSKVTSTINNEKTSTIHQVSLMISAIIIVKRGWEEGNSPLLWSSTGPLITKLVERQTRGVRK